MTAFGFCTICKGKTGHYDYDRQCWVCREHDQPVVTGSDVISEKNVENGLPVPRNRKERRARKAGWTGEL